LNRTPSAGPVAPSSHWASNVSAAKRFVFVTSLTSGQISSGVACT
jgi:hypothetical protein